MKVLIIKIIDRIIGGFILLVLSLFSRKRNPDELNFKNILVIQLWGIGETILTLPAITSLQKRYNQPNVTVLCTDRNKDVYEAVLQKTIVVSLNPLIILLFIIKNFRKFDLVIDMEEYLNISAIISFFIGRYRIGYFHNLRSRVYNSFVKYNDKQHSVSTFLDLLKPIIFEKKDENIPKLSYGKADAKKIDEILKRKKGKKVGIVPGAAESGKSRMWPKEKFIELCKKLIENKYCLVLVGTHREIPYNKGILENLDTNYVIDTTGKLNLRQLFCLVDKLNIVVTNDTGPLHIASAQKTKVVGLFGPNTPIRFGPYHTKNVTFYKKQACEFSPCINVHRGQVPDCLYQKESKDYQKCMKAISVNEVLDSVIKLI